MRPFTFQELFQLIIHFTDKQDKAEKIIKTIYKEWRVIDSNENILKALLVNDMDVVACDQNAINIHEADEALFLFALKNENDVFLKFAFQNMIIK